MSQDGGMVQGYYVVGYQFRRGVPTEEYLDFPLGMKMNFEEVRAGIYEGIFPPGLILQHPKGQACVVVGQYGKQEFKSLMESIEDGRDIAEK